MLEMNNKPLNKESNKLDLIVREILNQPDIYIKEALSIIKRQYPHANMEKIVKEMPLALFSYMTTKLKQAGQDLSDALKYPEMAAIFDPENILKAAQNHYRAEKVIAAAQKIYANRDELWANTVSSRQAVGTASKDQLINQLIEFLQLIRVQLRQQELSLQDILQIDPAKHIFTKSSRLGLILKLYEQLLQKQQPQEPSKELNLEQHLKARARTLGQMHATPGQQGLITQCGLNPNDQPNELARKAKQIMVAQHPDMNSGNKGGLFDAANELRQLAQHDLLEDYRAILEERRLKNPEQIQSFKM